MEIEIILIITLLILITYMLNPDLILSFLKNINDGIYYILDYTPNENFDLTDNGENSLDNPNNLNKLNKSNKSNKLNNLSANVDDDLKIPFMYNNATYGDNYFIDDGGNGTLGLTSSLCSKSCCTQQYPIPFELPDDILVKNSGEKYVRTNYTCNNGFQDTGCLCMTKEQSDFLKSRGKNM